MQGPFLTGSKLVLGWESQQVAFSVPLGVCHSRIYRWDLGTQGDSHSHHIP